MKSKHLQTVEPSKRRPGTGKNGAVAKPIIQHAGTSLALGPNLPPGGGGSRKLGPTIAKIATNSSRQLRTTTVEAKIDVGYGNTVFIRGSGFGLNWDRGVALQNVDSSTWVWTTDEVEGAIAFQLLLNDIVWAAGDIGTASAGERIQVTPSFR